MLCLMVMVFTGFKVFFFAWPLFFFMPFLFWFGKSRSRRRYEQWHSEQWNSEGEWEKPKRKNDELYEKPKRDGESEIYYF
jgi:hypothetical protein